MNCSSPPLDEHIRSLLSEQSSEPNERGWMSITSALVDEQHDMQAWKDYRTAEHISREKQEQWVQSQRKTLDQVWKEGGIPDSLRNPLLDPLTILRQQTVPQDLKIYGYTTAGEVATCILLADGSSFAELVQSDGTFSVVIPHERVRASSWEGKFTFIVNVTDKQNRLLTSNGFGLAAPRWAGRW
jgi:hypothetical protein